jgi:ribosome-associated protein
MLPITDQLALPLAELEWSYARSGGPGGQNVNKVASKAILRWNLEASPSLPEDVKARLRARQRNRITAEGTLIIASQRFRDQERNRQDCLDRLREMILEALEAPVPRKATRPTKGSQRRRLADKRLHSARKARRRPPGEE